MQAIAIKRLPVCFVALKAVILRNEQLYPPESCVIVMKGTVIFARGVPLLRSYIVLRSFICLRQVLFWLAPKLYCVTRLLISKAKVG